MLKCTINGQSVEVPEGTSIIEAFKYVDMDIAHYCWHPGLSVAGVCRLCMVKIEGNPRLQIACNTMVTEGMVVSNQDQEVQDAVKWGLDFHLINHPLDCPICDQAGECGLQDQYMKYGKYDADMAEQKVKKHKVVDLGERVVLDSERCILCSRCVRFTEEVSKTNELGIFNRGDHSEIGTYEGKPLNNNYSVNTVDICPVGALTSKDFRFKQRVWFLKDGPSVCTGCSTGCNISVYHNREGAWRVKPRYNEAVNGYWMCDKGRDIYKHVNRIETVVEGERENKVTRKKVVRLTSAKENLNGQVLEFSPAEVATRMGQLLKGVSADKVALVITGQHTVEELESVVSYFKNDLGSSQIYHWVNNPQNFDQFDGLLWRGDENPNTQGALRILAQHEIEMPWNDLSQKLEAGQIDTVLVIGPENLKAYSDFTSKVQMLSRAKHLIWSTACVHESLDQSVTHVVQLPLRTFAEKSGTFINYKGLEQKISPVTVMVDESLTVTELVKLLKGEDLGVRPVFNPDIKVQNEFLYVRGPL